MKTATESWSAVAAAAPRALDAAAGSACSASIRASTRPTEKGQRWPPPMDGGSVTVNQSRKRRPWRVTSVSRSRLGK